MSVAYHYPYEVAKIRGKRHGILKAEVPEGLRGKLVDYCCCLCGGQWPGCACPETEVEHAERMEGYLSKHPSVIKDRESHAAFVSQGGEQHNISAWRAWEALGE